MIIASTTIGLLAIGCFHCLFWRLSSRLVVWFILFQIRRMSAIISAIVAILIVLRIISVLLRIIFWWVLLLDMSNRLNISHVWVHRTCIMLSMAFHEDWWSILVSARVISYSAWSDVVDLSIMWIVLFHYYRFWRALSVWLHYSLIRMILFQAILFILEII